MLKLYLVRHGESAWNKLHLYTGQQDVPLSELGAQQAERLRERLHPIAFEAIYASPLRRAQETAMPTARAKKINLQLEARLAEIHHGAWEGQSTAVIREQYAEAYSTWRAQPQNVQMPDGESLRDVARRAQSFLLTVYARHAEGNVLIVTHDAVLRVIVLDSLQVGLEHFWRWRFDNASVSVLEHFAENEFRIALLNDCHHLGGAFTDCHMQAL